MRFYVKALWDEDAKVFYSESDIVGLHIEAATIEEFVEVMDDLAPQLVLDNHVTKQDFAKKSLIDMVSSIIFKPPSPGSFAAA
ncbi:DUF1902 domain-containing protein [Sulfitobacter dubius]|uniref:DUF1902 domain-containing protein n=1 Tax=Sulfitobacter dubius TaxID=218673 RepID=A0ABY3ZJ72_9RHOB|nr:DUF1902 domain-containing protein [Sulfitobacter dubius]UOA14532.1 hypothetical protein DSM109990_01338 [Sulfitobacter dubius]